LRLAFSKGPNRVGVFLRLALAKGPKRVGVFLRLALAKGHNRVGVFLRMETDPVSKTLCFLVFRILDDGQSSEAW
jgi:hypothetical protein